MEFFDSLLKRARGITSSQDSSADQGGTQQTQVQTRQPRPALGMQYQENRDFDSESAGKEIRTYRRDGINMIEEYERLNPDGTVTKTISIGDKKNGLKKFEVYKMDKSGIVRRVESASQGDPIPTEAVRELWMNDLKQMTDEPKGRIENEYDSRKENRTADTQIKQYIDRLKPEQRNAIFNKYKERLLTYGTNKLKNILIPKLEDNGSELGLTDEQKVEILETGIRKLRRRLSESIDEEKFFTEVWPRHEMFKDIDNDTQNSTSTPVSFTLQPNSSLKRNESDEMRPVSFTIRPEYGTTSYPQSGSQSRDYSMDNGNNSLMKDTWNDETVHNQYRTKKSPSNESQGIDRLSDCDKGIYDTFHKLHKHLKRHIEEDKSLNKEERELKENALNRVLQNIKKNFKINSSFIEEHDSEWDDRTDDGEPVEDIIDRLNFYLKRHINNDDSTNKEEKQEKLDFYDLALRALKYKLNGGIQASTEEQNRRPLSIEKTKSKEEKLKKIDLSDDDESYDYGMKVLKKLLRKTSSEKKIKDGLSKYLKDEDRSSKRKHRDDTHGQQIELSKDGIRKIPKGERVYPETVHLEEEKQYEPWKNFYYKLVDKPSSIEKEKKIPSFDSLLSEVKSLSLGSKESESSNESSLDKNRFAHKYQTSSKTETTSKSQNEEEAKKVILDLDAIMGKMRALIQKEEERTSKSSNKESNNYSSYNLQPRQLDVTTKKMEYDPPKESKHESLDFNSLISKLKNLTQNINRQMDSVPKQVKHSSTPYSYHKPPHGTTRISNRNLGTRENEQNRISFQINPQDYSKSSDRSPGNDEIKYKKSCSSDKDFMPWWFGNTAHSSHEPTEPLNEKRPVNNSLIGKTMFNDNFFGDLFGNNFSKPQLTNF